MQISRSRPFARGVDQLMYVGDVDVGGASFDAYDALTVALGAIAAPKGKRVMGAVIAAGIVYAFNRWWPTRPPQTEVIVLPPPGPMNGW